MAAKVERSAGAMAGVPMAGHGDERSLAERLSKQLERPLARRLASLLLVAAAFGVALVPLNDVSSRFALYGPLAVLAGILIETHFTAHAHLKEIAGIDPLTQVANVGRLYDELFELESKKTPFALLIFDLDDLKTINDTYGHTTGSAAIVAVARALRTAVRSTDCVARYGGDEFAVVLRNSDRTGAFKMIERFGQALVEESRGMEPNLGVSAGMALYGIDGFTPEELLNAADAAMYSKKRSSRNRATGETSARE
ncbi:MAG: GGDEF domain-containing protein [Actinomycetota bacterium]